MSNILSDKIYVSRYQVDQSDLLILCNIDVSDYGLKPLKCACLLGVHPIIH